MIERQCTVCGTSFLRPARSRRIQCGSAACVAALASARNARWRTKNLQHNRRWKTANAEGLAVRRREYYERNREQIIDGVRRWRAANRERSNRGAAINSATRRGRLAKDPETQDYAWIILSDPCVYCGCPAEAIDHIVALSAGGADHWSNLTPACKSCNSRKQALPLLKWMLRRLEAV